MASDDEVMQRTCTPQTRRLAAAALAVAHRGGRRHADAEMALLRDHLSRMTDPADIARMKLTLRHWSLQG